MTQGVAQRLVLGLALWLLACAPGPPDVGDLTAARALADAVDAEALMPWVERLSADHLADTKLSCAGYETLDKYPACELSRDAAVALVRETFIALGYDTRVFVQGEPPDEARNVVAELPGTSRPDEVVLIAAHVDAFYAGADDNSSGVAAMLELARVAAEHRFARTLRFVGFDLEERGSRGSARYVGAGHADDVVAALILECIGFTDLRPGSQDSPPGLPLGEVGDALFIAANGDSRELAQRMLAINHALELVELRAVIAGGSGAFPLTGALLRSDNGPFWLRGLPAVMLTDSADYRNPNYHEASDTPDTLDPAFLAASTRLVAASMAVLAEVQP